MHIGYKIILKAIEYRNEKKGNLLFGKLNDQQSKISQISQKIKNSYIKKLINYNISETKFNNNIILRRLELKMIKIFFRQLVKPENLIKRAK